MVIRAPDVDEAAVPAPVFIIVVGNIRCEIGRDTVVAENDAILVVAVVRRAQPDRSVLLICRAAFEEHVHNAPHSFGMQRALAVPAIERHAEIRKILLKCRELLTIRDILKQLQTVLLGKGKILVPVTVDDALRRLHNIRPVVAVLGELHGLSQQFQIARIHRHGKQIHLIARIVDIVLAVHGITRRAQEFHKCRADCCPAPVPDVQRPCRIRTDILYLDARRAVGRQCAEFLPRRKHSAQCVRKHSLFEVEIEEAGTCDLRMIEPIAREAIPNRRSNLLRGLTKDTRRLHGKVRRKVAQFLFRGLFQKNRRQCRALGQNALRCSRFHGSYECLFNLLFYIHLD